MASMKREWNRSHVTISSTGSANAYVLTFTTAPASYINGQRFSFKANFANTGSATANINGLGAKTINQHGGSGLAALAGSEIQSGHHVTLEYDSGADVLVLVSPSPATSGSLGTMASQNANAVAITGGTITGITDLAVADGGTGRSTLAAHGPLIGNGTSGVTVGSPGTAGQVWTSNGAAADPTFQSSGAGAKKIKTTVFIASGTYTADTNLLCGFAETIGGGGGGGGVDGGFAGGGGGGSGGYSRKSFSAADVGVSQTVTIGAAGSAGNSSGSNGGNGGDTSLGSLCIGKGGTGGTGQTGMSAAAGGQAANGGAGGVAGTGDVTIAGAAGGPGFGLKVNATGGSGFIDIGGYGASGPWGGGATSAGNAGSTNSGSGGSGAASSNLGAAAGAGAKGYCVVTEYLSA